MQNLIVLHGLQLSESNTFHFMRGQNAELAAWIYAVSACFYAYICRPQDNCSCQHCLQFIQYHSLDPPADLVAVGQGTDTLAVL